jgi:hypothetical protein
VTVVLHGEPRAWPPADLFSAADFLAELAAANGGQAQSSVLAAEAIEESTAGELTLAADGPERPSGAGPGGESGVPAPPPPERAEASRAAAIAESLARAPADTPPSEAPRLVGFSCWMDPDEAERADRAW